jgi:hypothetical protein
MRTGGLRAYAVGLKVNLMDFSSEQKNLYFSLTYKIQKNNKGVTANNPSCLTGRIEIVHKSAWRLAKPPSFRAKSR